MSFLLHGARRPGVAESNFWMVVDPPFITATGFGAPPEGTFDKTIDAHGALLLPGAIDCHVHFREPGMTHKATIDSESRAAVAGGVTSFIEMPNTSPATTTIPLWREKCEIAQRDSLANYAFFLGASTDNFNVLCNADYTLIPGVKVFMGSSTGSLLVESDNLLQRIFREVPALIAVHAEDNARIAERLKTIKARYADGMPIEMHSAIRDVQACYQATERAVKLAEQFGTRLHICHITTAAELALLDRRATSISEKRITSEVSPHHLLFTSGDYPRLGSRIKMNPAVKGMRDRIALRRALGSGVIDMVATDHAPHLLTEKTGDALTALSGAPAVQFALPTLLSLYDEATVERVYCNAPAEVYRIDRRGSLTPGNYADFTLIDATAPYEVTDADVLSPCGWTPLQGTTLRHRIRATYVNGQPAFTAASSAPAPPTSTAPETFAASPSSLPLRFTPSR